ncbi:hypothetical protein M405DRAFT_857333 [Rhizopogon salebrosus TDB-379]|nr:hypothetical protein M405DRAFT_857333 [Rhizopogon salebrosus TDB-379]
MGSGCDVSDRDVRKVEGMMGIALESARSLRTCSHEVRKTREYLPSDGPLPTTPRTWEDDFLQELDNPVARAPSPALSALSTLSVAPEPPSHVPASSATIASTATVDVIANCHTTSTSMSISQTHAARPTSASTQLQVDISHLSLTDSSPAPQSGPSELMPAPTVARRGHISARPAQAATTTAVSAMLPTPVSGT